MTIHTTTVRPGSGIAEGNFVVECSCGAKINVGGSRDFAENSAIRHIAREEAAELQDEAEQRRGKFDADEDYIDGQIKAEEDYYLDVENFQDHYGDEIDG